MDLRRLERINYDEFISQSAKAEHDRAVAANDAFILAMAKAVRRGKEKATPGIFVDPTPLSATAFIRPLAPMSACGSPAAMCIERGNPDGGAPLALKS